MIRLDLKPDPKPAIDRKGFRDTWRALQLLAEPHRKALIEHAKAEEAFLAMTAGGDRPEFWCDSCRAPFFDGDDYQVDEDGSISCRYDADGNRVGRCFRELMEA